MIESHSDKVKRIFEAVYIVTDRKGEPLLRYEVCDEFDCSNQMLTIRKAIIRLMIECNIPFKHITKTFKLSGERVSYIHNQSESLQVKAFYNGLLSAFNQIEKRLLHEETLLKIRSHAI